MGANFLITVASSLFLQFPQASTTTQPTQPPQPSDTIETERPGPGIAYERPSDVLGYNRVQGLSLGAGYRFPLSVVSGANLYATIRYGLSDDRVTGRLSMVRDAVRGRFSVSGYYDVVDIDPFANGRSLMNSVNALLVAHDNGDYALAGGGSGTLETAVGSTLDLVLAGRVEKQSSLRRTAESEVNDFLGGSGQFPVNPLVKEGTFAIVTARLRGIHRTRWNLIADLLVGSGQAIPRLMGDVRRSFGWHRGITLLLKAGIGARPALPQTLFRLGGLNTVRGFEYGVIRSQAFWAGQLDFAPVGSRVRPVVFLDAGQAATASTLFSSTALVGGGVGLSLLSGLIRLDFSQPISPDSEGKVRFDIVVEGVR